MGLSCCSVELIIQEHLYHPLKGDVLLIGRQNVDIPPQAMLNLLSLYGLTPRVPLAIEQPGSLIHDVLTLTPETARIADIAVFHSLAECTVKALDVSDYEGAEIVHDMNVPVPDDLKEKFDFIFDGSCMDNIFDGPRVLYNMSEMLRPGGRIILYNASNSAPTGYLQYSPDWFYDFFAINEYSDCKVYIHEFPRGDDPVIADPMPPGGLPPQGGCLWHFDPFVIYHGQRGFQNSEIYDNGHRYVHVVAEKGTNSTSSNAPCQMHYRGSDTEPYLRAAQRFRESARPIFQPRTGEPFTAPSISGWEVVYPISRWSRRTYPPQPPSPHVNEAPVQLTRTTPVAVAKISAGESSSDFASEAARLRLTRERDEAHKQLQRLEEEKESQIQERDAAIADLEEEKESRIQERDAALTERDRLRYELEAKIASHSWRLTAPLRAISTKLRGLHRQA